MENPKFFRKLRTKLLKLSLETVVIYSIYHMITEYLYDIATCQGVSMEPTLFSRDLVVINKKDKYSVKRGDIVIVRSPICPTKYLCKRVVHLSGDIIHNPQFSGKIPKGSVWLEGDNSLQSTDSRHFGPIPKGLIQGKAMYVVWPLMKDLRI